MNLNGCINSYLYLSMLKMADITPVHKKESRSAKNNYRQVSILPNISKLYERIMFKQISGNILEVLFLIIIVDLGKI